MKNVARPTKDSSKPKWKRGDPWPLRVASAEELAEDRRRCLAAREAQRRSEEEGNLCRMLAAFAEWRACDACGARILFCDANLKTDTRCICGPCEARRQRLRLDLPALVVAHVKALLMVANDNAVVLS